MNAVSRTALVLIGLVAANAAAAPPPRIVCDDVPRLEGADRVFLSTDEVGAVQVVGDAAPLAPADVESDAVAKMDPATFCQAHEGIDTFILPAPRIIDDLPEPERETDRPGALQPASAAPGSPRVVTDDGNEMTASDDDAADGDDAPAAEKAGLAGPPDGRLKALDPTMSGQAGCDVSATDAPSDFMWILLPLLFGLRCRRGVAR